MGDVHDTAGGARAPPPPPLPAKGALGKRLPGQGPPQGAPAAPNQAAAAAGPTPSKPMVKLFWDKLPDRQVNLPHSPVHHLLHNGEQLAKEVSIHNDGSSVPVQS